MADEHTLAPLPHGDGIGRPRKREGGDGAGHEVDPAQLRTDGESQPTSATGEGGPIRLFGEAAVASPTARTSTALCPWRRSRSPRSEIPMARKGRRR